MKKQKRISFQCLLLMATILLFNASPWAVGAGAEDGLETQLVQPKKESLPEKMDKLYKDVDETLMSAAKRIDSFFTDDNYTEEANKTYFRTRFSTFFEEGESAESKFSYKFRLRLPGAEKRFGLSVGSDDDLLDGFDDTPNSIARDRLDEVEDDTNVALEFFALDQEKHNLKFSGGVRFRSGSTAGYGSTRYRYKTQLEDWTVRFTERLRWYEDDGWESRSRLDFETQISDKLYFRTTPGIDWYERRDGFYYSWTNSVYQLLDENRAVQYEVNNFFYTEISDHHQEVNVRIRYRQRLWRDWLILEVAPQLAWYEERDYDTVPGLFIRLETWFGEFPKLAIIDY